MASLVWGILWRAALTEGDAASTSFGACPRTGFRAVAPGDVEVEAVALLAGVVRSGEAVVFRPWRL